MFIGRDRELSTLERLYASNGFQFPVVYGRRRVGKTALLNRFTAEKPTIFFTAVEESITANIRNLSRSIYAFEHPDADPDLAPVYPTLQTALEAVFAYARDRRLVLVIDEYPYLAKADKSVSSVLQMLIDRNLESSQLFLVLCGSSLSFMKEQVLGEKSPLYGRRTAQIELKPFSFFDARAFFPNVAPEDALAYYGIVGGIPLYLQKIDASLTVSQNIEVALLDPMSLLYEEPTNLLLQEVQKAPMYNSIISAVASGKTANNEIATTVGVSPAELRYYLQELQRIGLMKKEQPILGSSRRGVYQLSDNLFRFWYRFVYPNKAAIERGLTRRVLKAIDAQLPMHLGPIFEDVCRVWLWQQSLEDKLPVEFDDLGRWWGNNPLERREEEIDIVGVADGKPVLLAECKWRNEPMVPSILDTLRNRATLLRAPADTQLYLFSKSGFVPALVEQAAGDMMVELVSFYDMLG